MLKRSSHSTMRTRNLWNDSENEDDWTYNTPKSKIRHLPVRKSTMKTMRSSTPQEDNCCLICSVLPALCQINCCDKHFTILNADLKKKIIYARKSQLFRKPQIHLKKRFRSFSDSQSSSSSFSLTNSTKKRSSGRKRRSIISKNSLNSSIMSCGSAKNITSSKIIVSSTSCSRDVSHNGFQRATSSSTSVDDNRNVSNREKRSERNFSIGEQRVRRKLVKLTSDQIPVPRYSLRSHNRDQRVFSDSEEQSSPRISLQRVVHVKDEDEDFSNEQSVIGLNMAQATEQMMNRSYSKPKIVLKRIFVHGRFR